MTDQRRLILHLAEKYKNIAMLCPLYKNLPAPAHESIVALAVTLSRGGMNLVPFHVKHTCIVPARNLLVKHFVEKHRNKRPYDLAFWLDSDHVFKVDDFFALLHHYDTFPGSTLSATYYARTFTDDDGRLDTHICAYSETTKGRYTHMVHGARESGAIIKVDAAGLGFCFCAPQVLCDVWDRYGLKQFMPVLQGGKHDGFAPGEDFTWWKKVRKCGYDVYLDTTVVVGHCGGVIYGPKEENETDADRATEAGNELQ